MESVEEVKRRSKGKESRFGRRYGFEIKLRCVKLYLEEGVPFSLLAKEVGASTDGVRRRVKAYQERGEEGLRNRVRSLGHRRKLPGPVRTKIIEIKKREPFFGVQRISHLLKRVFFLSASPETVRRTLQEESLIVPSRKRHFPNITCPRFFERSTPNQMCQGDIFTYRKGERKFCRELKRPEEAKPRFTGTLRNFFSRQPMEFGRGILIFRNCRLQE